MKNKKILFSVIGVMLALVLSVGSLISASAAQENKKAENEFSVAAKSALLLDYDSGKIVYAQNELEHLPIASMVKIMTLLLTFDELEKNKLSYADDVTASEYATSMGGSQAFLDTGSAYKLEQLIKSIVVGSANDSCVAIAERISGSSDAFVSKMNERARGLGMQNTNFVNCTGLPALEQYSCARDVGVMTRELIRHKDFFNFSTIWMFDFIHPSGRVTGLANTNKLLRAYGGCDGGKTGFTNEAKFCLSATAKRGNTRLISVVCGAETSKIRNGENAKLFNYGFNNFETKRLVSANIPLQEDWAVAGGKTQSVKVVPEGDYFAFVKKGDIASYKVVIAVDPIVAPIRAGEKVGEAQIYCNNERVGKVDLLSCDTVKKLSYFDIVDDFVENW